MLSRIDLPSTRWALRLLGGALVLGGGAVLAALPAEVLTDGSRLAVVVMTLVGVALVGWKSGLTIDPFAHELVRWWGVFVRLGDKRTRLDQLEAVEVVRRVSRSGQHSSVSYVVRLIDGQQQHRISSHRNELVARHRAEMVARALGVPLDDRTYAGAPRRRPEQLDDPLGLRLAREGSVMDPGPPPARIEVSEQGGGTVLRLPAAGLRASGGVVLVLPLLTLPVSVVLFALPMMSFPIPGIGLAAVGALVAIPALLLAAVGMGRALRREEVTVSDVGGLCLGWRLGGVGRRRTMAGVEVEELFVSTPEAVSPIVAAGPFLVVRGDGASLTFGRGLSAEEAAWLAARLQWELARPYATGSVNAGTVGVR